MDADRPTLQRLIGRFTESFAGLGDAAPPLMAEQWAVLVHEAMSGRGRQYHTVDHVFDISQGASPLATLAILFHDTVYYQADGGLLPQLESRVGDAVVEQDGAVKLAPLNPEQDPVRSLVAALFGFDSGSTLSPYGGLNEFLSALLAAREIGDHLPRATVAQVAACIEATIPFRPVGEDGVGPLQRLHCRLAGANTTFGLGLDEAAMQRTVVEAADVANRDVGNFASKDPSVFLDNTWKLLPETNNALRGQRLYTVTDYRVALEKMAGFLGFLDPGVVFLGYGGHPQPADLEAMTAQAKENITLGVRYLRAKLLAARVIEALALATGGNAPIALFMGDLPEPGRPATGRLEDFLPSGGGPACPSAEATVLSLLETGRTLRSGFDLKTSPLAAYLYRSLGDEGVSTQLERAKAVEDPKTWLDGLPGELVAAVAKASAEVAVSRRPGLLAFA
ncbi:MAG: hypothetical protein R3F62_00165 [Planctomycetota bacterium]